MRYCLMERSLQCSKCGESFTHKNKLKAHYRTVHGVILPTPKLLVCGACPSKFSKIEEYDEHIRDVHNVTTSVECMKFESKSAFLQWKREIEGTNPVKFITRSSKVSKGNRLVYYRCNRAGPARFRVSFVERKRKTKSQGSCKTNVHCPARITATFHPDGSVEASFCLSHFGHPFEVRHIPLPSRKKKTVDSSAPFDSSLEDDAKDEVDKTGEQITLDSSPIDIKIEEEHEAQLLIDLSKSHDDSFSETLNELGNQFLSSINECTSQFEIDIVKQTLRTMETKLTAVRKAENFPFLNLLTNDKVNVCNSVEPQRTFFIKNNSIKCHLIDPACEESAVLSAEVIFPSLGS